MRIGVNALSIQIGGGITTLRNLIPQMLKQDPNNQYFIFVSAEHGDKVLPAGLNAANLKIIKIKTHNIIWRLIQEQFLLIWLVLKYKLDILMAAGNISSFFVPCKKVLWVLNIDPFVGLSTGKESFFRQARQLGLRILTVLSIKTSDLTIFISEYSRSIADKMVHLRPGQGKVIYLGVDHSFFQTDVGEKQSNKYILSVSSISKRKNYEVLLQAYPQLPVELIANYRLVLVGKITAEYKTELLALIANRQIAERIYFAGAVEGQELLQYYHEASLFVLPSLVESFGLPVLEAMASRVPVVVSSATSLPEIAGEAGLVFDSKDPNDLAEKIKTVLSNKVQAKKMVELGLEWSAKFTWKNTAKATIFYCNELMGVKG